MKRAWVVGLVAAALLVGGGLVWRSRQANAGAAGSALPKATASGLPGTAASAARPPMELAAGDVLKASRVEMSRLVPVSGGLRAVNSAMLRAKVAAEVRSVGVREGDRVAAGQVLLQLDDTEYRWRLRQAEDQATAAKSQLDLAERTLANNKALVDQGFISKTALDTSLMSAEGARASLQAAKAAAEIARKAVTDSVVHAPLAGLVAQRLVQPGERVAVDARLLEIVDLSRIELEAALAPEEVGAVRVGQVARLQVDGLAEPVSARVARINPSTQAGTRAVTVYLAVDAHPALRQGLFARGGIQTDQHRALVVPASAVRTDQAKPYVLVAEAGLVRQREVQLGARGEVALAGGAEEPVIEVTQGLAEGALVLRGSVGSVREGTPVKLPSAPVAAATSGAAASAPR